METLLAAVAVTLFPLSALLGVSLVADRMARRRAAAIERQITLTDAIHRDLGAVVAPCVTRRPWGRWRVSIAVPFERPALVGAVVEIVRRAFPDRFDLVLTPREGAERRQAPRLVSQRPRRSPSWA